MSSPIANESTNVSIGEAMLDRLAEAALDARARAYVPYTSFDAGAAVLDDHGSIHGGAVVENVSLGLAMCAERSAMFAAANGRSTSIRALALAAPNTADGLTYPCGACCQVALELGGADVMVMVIGPDGQRTLTSIAELLPNGPKIVLNRS